MSDDPYIDALNDEAEAMRHQEAIEEIVAERDAAIARAEKAEHYLQLCKEAGIDYGNRIDHWIARLNESNSEVERLRAQIEEMRDNGKVHQPRST